MPAPDPAPDPAEARIRDAATVILVRDMPKGMSVLMGQRGHGAAFMPSKFVFPGGGVDSEDDAVPAASDLDPLSLERLSGGVGPGRARALAQAAIRELWEEAGLILGKPGVWPAPPPVAWSGFAATGHLPHPAALSFVFRAITPPGRTRRFDARFFLARAEDLVSDPDDFSAAADELSHLSWVPLSEARRLDLPFITEIVLAEVEHAVGAGDTGGPVPFFDNSGPVPVFRRIA